MQITTKEAAALLEELKAGKRIQGIDGSNRGQGVIYYNNGLIHWQHYGSSANSATARDLKFILESIFNDCVTWDYCTYSKYHIGYVPVNPRYTGIDYSMSHPNVYRL